MDALIYPSTEQIAAALESLLTVAERSYSLPTTDRPYWRRQVAAYSGAQTDLLAGRMPFTNGADYLVPSASRPGTYHLVRQTGGIWRCGCEARVFCRHAAMVGAVEYAIDLLDQGLIGSVPPEQDDDDFSDVGPVEPRARFDDRAVRSLVGRLTAARAQRWAAV